MSQKSDARKKKARPSRPTEPPASAVSLYTVVDIARHLEVPEAWVRPVLRGLKAYRVEETENGRTIRLYKPEILEKVTRRMEAKRIQRNIQLQDDAAAYWRALGALSVSTRSLKQLSRQLSAVSEELEEHRSRLRRKPPAALVPIHTLADEKLTLVAPVGLLVRPLRQAYWRASLLEADMETSGKSLDQAVLALRELLGAEYVRLRCLRFRRKDEGPDSRRWQVLKKLIRQTAR
jgi:hypothetical protein